MITVRVLDIETTGLAPTDEVVEVAHYDVTDGALDIKSMRSALVRPIGPIPALSSAVHHLTDSDVMNATPWSANWPMLVPVEAEATGDGELPRFAAHMAEFERQWLDAVIKAEWICTWKCSLRQWPDLESHSLQYLRYRLTLPADAALAMPPHRAAPDAYLCGLLLVELLKRQTIETLVVWSAEPPLFTVIDFGKHRGTPMTEVDSSYLDWLANKEHTMGDDWRWNARRELERRAEIPRQKAAAERAVYMEMMLAALPGAATVRDLENWYHGEAETLAKYGILVGSDEYDTIIKACGARKKVLLESGEPNFAGAGPAT